MSDPQPSSLRSALDYFKPRNFLRHEWPYLLVLVLALFGIAYTSFARTPMTLYWIILGPLIGIICVVSRWGELPGRDERIRLVWTQVAHWAAVLVAIRLVFIADVERMMNSDASALAALTCWRSAPSRPASISRRGASAWSACCWRRACRASPGSNSRRCC